MFRSYRIGTLCGFPIEINPSFLILLAVVLLTMGGLQGLVAVLVAFASVLLHELGHALMARKLGVSIAGIELYFFGGAAKMTSQPRTANDEIAIAAAGPAVSFALGGVSLALGWLSGSSTVQLLGWINLVIGAFNLIPALPMDGGRILRALLTRKLSYARATEGSVMVARGFAVLLGLYALMSMQLYLVFLAVVLWVMGSAERHAARTLAPAMSYDRSGYRCAGMPEVEVMPRGFWPGSARYAEQGYDGGYGAGYEQDRDWQGRGPRSGMGRARWIQFHRPIVAGGWVIRQRNGRRVIEPL